MKAVAALLLLCSLQLTFASYLFVGSYDSTLSVYSINENNGLTSYVSNVTSDSVSWLAWLPHSAYLYGANEHSNHLTAYSFNSATGNMAVINSVVSGGTGPVSVAVHSSGQFIFTANYVTGDVVAFAVSSNGSIGALVSSLNVGIHPHQVVLRGSALYVPTVGSDYIAQLVFDTSSGLLSYNQVAPTANVTAGQGPRHLVFHPTLAYAYVINELGSTVAQLAYNSQTGTLSFVAQVSTLLPGFSGTNTGAEVAISPDGRYLYASNRGNNTIAIFSINLNSGAIALLALEDANSQIHTPRSFVIAPSGGVLVVANQESGTVLSFNVSSTTGLLTETSTISGLTTPAFVGIYSTSTPATTGTTGFVATTSTTGSTSGAIGTTTGNFSTTGTTSEGSGITVGIAVVLMAVLALLL